MPGELPDEQKSATDWSKLSGIGFELAAAVGGFTFAGYLWDRHFGSIPWGTLTGAVLGLIGGMYNLIHQTLRATRTPSRETSTKRGDGER
jgi:F0F1-type ATP synthase assembly protein I